jgi:uncharacterized delta-60 repeat protein
MKRNSTIAVCILIFSLLVNKSSAQPGSLDMTFNPGTGANPSLIYCMALETNGRIIIGGDFTKYNGVNRSHVARLNTDGSLDLSFYFGGTEDWVKVLTAQTDGKILIGGQFGNANGVPYNQPVRLRPDGSLDVGFDTTSADGNGAYGEVRAIALQTDGKIVIGGTFTIVAGTNSNYIARLNTNGALDVTFNPGVGANNYVNALGLQSNGKVIIGGMFTTVSNTPRNYLARLDTDGSLDMSFDALLANGNVGSVVVTPQDQIVIGGSFSSVNGYSRNGIARLNSDGSVDTSFAPGSGANGTVTAVALQTDGKVIIAGGFTAFNGTGRAGLARLNTNGTLDVPFNPGTSSGGGYPNIYCVASQPDGKTLVGGWFTSFNGTNINGIVRLNSDTSSTTLNLLNAQNYFGTYLQGTVSNTYRIEYTSKLNTPSLWTPLFNVTLQTNPQFILDPNPASGQRFYRAVALP